MNLTKMTNEELYDIIAKAYDTIAEAKTELERYKIVECTVCGISEIVFRGEELPFITWTMPSGHPLCPRCSSRFKNKLPEELTITAEQEIMALLD